MGWMVAAIRGWFDKNFTVKGLVAFAVFIYTVVPDSIARNELWTHKVHPIIEFVSSPLGRVGLGCVAALLIWADHRSVLKKKSRPPNDDWRADVREAKEVPPPPPTPPIVPVATPRESGNRRMVNVTPEYLIGLFKGGHLSVQTEQLVKAFIGAWMTISGSLEDVATSTNLRRMVTFEGRSIFNDNQTIMFFEGEHWCDVLSTLTRGTKITVVGQITEITNLKVQLDNCELVES